MTYRDHCFCSWCLQTLAVVSLPRRPPVPQLRARARALWVMGHLAHHGPATSFFPVLADVCESRLAGRRDGSALIHSGRPGIDRPDSTPAVLAGVDAHDPDAVTAGVGVFSYLTSCPDTPCEPTLAAARLGRGAGPAS